MSLDERSLGDKSARADGPTTTSGGPAKKPKRDPNTSLRWSEDRYSNPQIPNYIPPEMFLLGNGAALYAFTTRATLTDTKRMLDRQAEDQYFMRRNGVLKVTPKFDGSGRRTNSFAQILTEKQARLQRDFTDMARSVLNVPGGLNDSKQIVKKIYFTEKQLENKSHGAIIGARGATHQQLQRETRCKVVIGGRGMTDVIKEVNLRDRQNAEEMAQDRPHVRITAPNEKCLQDCVERIEWMLSDLPDAIKLRDDNRIKLAIANFGSYQPGRVILEGGQPPAATTATAARGPAAGAAGVAATAAPGDEDLDDFLNELRS